MRRNEAIGIQDPSASPTYALSRQVPATDVSPSTRRTLFSSHLSRRAVPITSTHLASSEPLTDPFTITSRNANNYAPSQRAVQSQPMIFEPSRSPTRSHSPPKQVPQSQIILLDSLGRPVLPHVPKLPNHLLEDTEEDHDDDGASVHEPWASIDHDINSSSIGRSTHQAALLHDLIDTTTFNTDLEKIESILSDMQALQKARARTTASDFDTSFTIDGVSARTRGKARTRQVQDKTDGHRTGMGGVGATLKPEDKDELLGLIMTSLRRRVQDADEDAWMFGDELLAANGVSVTGGYNVSRDDEGIY